MIDFGKLGEQNQYWNQWYQKPATQRASGGGNTSITKPPSVTAGAGETTAPLTGGTTAANTTAAYTGGTAMPANNYTGYLPSQWQTASDTLTGIAQNGNPVNYGNWYNQAKQTAQYDITDAIRQAVETAGMGGMKYSTSLGRTGQDIAARTMAGLGRDWTNMELGAQQQGIQNQMGAAQGLAGLGQQYAYLPMDVANNMFNMGQGMQGAMNQEISPYYNLWNSLQSYNSPWLNNMMQLAQSSQPQQYQQSGMSQFLSGIGSFLPFLFL